MAAQLGRGARRCRVDPRRGAAGPLTSLAAAAPGTAAAVAESRPRYFPLFDSLRGVAAMLVLTFHVVLITPLGLETFGRPAQVFGFVGVELFFVISGFLLYRPFVAARVEGRAPQPLKVFFRRRALRILPAYFVILTI